MNIIAFNINGNIKVFEGIEQYINHRKDEARKLLLNGFECRECNK